MEHILNITFEDNITVDADGVIHDESYISFFNPEHIALLFHNYTKLKCATEGRFNSDGYYLMMAFDNLAEKVLSKHPLYAECFPRIIRTIFARNCTGSDLMRNLWSILLKISFSDRRLPSRDF